MQGHSGMEESATSIFIFAREGSSSSIIGPHPTLSKIERLMFSGII